MTPRFGIDTSVLVRLLTGRPQGNRLSGITQVVSSE